MATSLKSSGKLGPGKTDLKRVEVYLTNEVYEVFRKEAEAQGRLTKNYLEVHLTTRAQSLSDKQKKKSCNT